MTQPKKRLSLVALLTALLLPFQNCSRPGTQVNVLNSLANYITNADFERGLTGYIQTGGPGTAETISAAAKSGALGLRLAQAAVAPESLPALSPHKVYNLSFWARVVVLDPQNANEPYPHVQVNTGFVSLDNAGTYVPETMNRIKVKSSSWQKYEYTFEPSELAGHYWKLNLSLTSSPDSRNVVDFDSLALEEVQIAP